MTTDQGKKILLVEDDAAIRKILRSELEKEGIGVLEATNGEEALGMIVNRRPQLIVLDIIMPKMHGIDMLRKLREIEWGKNIPVLFLTNFADDPRVMQAVSEGYGEVLKKAESRLEEVVAKIKEKIK
jgi:two-component system, OmpR family, phosphate regulon response regulator PhoB